MNVVKKVSVVTISVLALAAATLLGSKFHDKINNGIAGAKNKIVNVFKSDKSKSDESKSDESESDKSESDE